LVSSLLDSHPSIGIANGGIDIDNFPHNLFNATDFLERVVHRCLVRAERGEKVAGYTYAVEGGHNGKWDKLQVIGVKRGGSPVLFGVAVVNHYIATRNETILVF
jgi:hypothetical protein